MRWGKCWGQNGGQTGIGLEDTGMRLEEHWDQMGDLLRSNWEHTGIVLGVYWEGMGVDWDEMGCTGMRWGGLG